MVALRVPPAHLQIGPLVHEPFVTAEVVAEHLGLSTSLIRKATVSGPHPIPHHRIPGGRSVRYLLSEVTGWMQNGGITG